MHKDTPCSMKVFDILRQMPAVTLSTAAARRIHLRLPARARLIGPSRSCLPAHPGTSRRLTRTDNAEALLANPATGHRAPQSFAQTEGITNSRKRPSDTRSQVSIGASQ
jgi:hypothetical protein